MMMRGVAITKGAGSPNAAKLFLDYMLSREARSLREGRLTPYRGDIARADVPSDPRLDQRGSAGERPHHQLRQNLVSRATSHAMEAGFPRRAVARSRQ
jgi:ABC-type Fe3+ transport system substrate-binding protein